MCILLIFLHCRLRPPQVVPFRDSKLTRVLQGFFCGRGTSSMVVNINPCASIYDETLQALKFSAIATQVGKKNFYTNLMLVRLGCTQIRTKLTFYIISACPWPIQKVKSGLHPVSTAWTNRTWYWTLRTYWGGGGRRGGGWGWQWCWRWRYHHVKS